MEITTQTVPVQQPPVLEERIVLVLTKEEACAIAKLYGSTHKGVHAKVKGLGILKDLWDLVSRSEEYMKTPNFGGIEVHK